MAKKNKRCRSYTQRVSEDYRREVAALKRIKPGLSDAEASRIIAKNFRYARKLLYWD